MPDEVVVKVEGETPPVETPPVVVVVPETPPAETPPFDMGAAFAALLESNQTMVTSMADMRSEIGRLYDRVNAAENAAITAAVEAEEEEEEEEEEVIDGEPVVVAVVEETPGETPAVVIAEETPPEPRNEKKRGYFI